MYEEIISDYERMKKDFKSQINQYQEAMDRTVASHTDVINNLSDRIVYIDSRISELKEVE